MLFRSNIREKVKLQLRADAFNAMNHQQYTLGRVNNVRLRNTFSSFTPNIYIPGDPLFGKYDQVYSSNPRNVQVSARLTF